MKTLRILLSAVCLLLAVPAQTHAQEIPPLIPQPREVKILADTPVPAQVAEQLDIDFKVPDSWDEEQYMLRITQEGVTIRARTPQGVIWAPRSGNQRLSRIPHADIYV